MTSSRIKAWGFFCYGRWRFRQQNYKAALGQFQKAAELLSKEWFIVWIGICEYRTEDYKAAQVSLKRAAEIEPTSAIVHAYLGSTYEQLGQLNDAIEEVRRFLELRPRFWDRAHWENKVGSWLLAVGRPQEACLSFERAASLKPCAEYYCNLATAYYHEGLFDQSQSACERARSLNPAAELRSGISKIYEQIGIAYSARRMFEMAVGVYQLAIQLRPNEANPYFNLGVAYGQVGARGKEIEAYRHAIECDPNDAQSWTNLALAYRDAGQSLLATQAWDKNLELNLVTPKVAPCHTTGGCSSTMEIP